MGGGAGGGEINFGNLGGGGRMQLSIFAKKNAFSPVLGSCIHHRKIYKFEFVYINIYISIYKSGLQVKGKGRVNAKNSEK